MSSTAPVARSLSPCWSMLLSTTPHVSLSPRLPLILLTLLVPLPLGAADALPARNISYNDVSTSPRTPEEERRAFVLPEGFEIELVAAESDGIGKFVNVTWDARM